VTVCGPTASRPAEVYTIYPDTRYVISFSQTRSRWSTYCHTFVYTTQKIQMTVNV